MAKRANEPAYGKWAAPSGYLEIGETLQEGAARETREETGVDISPISLELYSIVNMVAIEQVAVVFRTEFLEKPNTVPGPECTDVAFLSQEQIGTSDIAWPDASREHWRVLFHQIQKRKFGIQLIDIALRPGETYTSRFYPVEREKD